MDTIGERIKYLRRGEQLDISELSRRCAISRCNLSKIERNIVMPSYRTIASITGYFKVSSDWLIFGDYRAADKQGSGISTGSRLPMFGSFDAQKVCEQLSRLDKKRQVRVLDFISFELKLQEGKKI